MSAARKLFSPSYWRSDSAIASWLRGAGWLFLSSLIERVAALAQTVLIARAIDIQNYGRYALLFSTISLLSPIVSLQLPYSVVYFVSRFQTRDPARAGAVVLLGRRLTLATTGFALAVAIVFASPLSRWLFAEGGFGWPIVLGGVILLASVQAGLSDAVLQASERFRVLAQARVATAVLSVAALVLVLHYSPTLTTVLAVVAAGTIFRLIAVAIPARAISKRLAAETDFRQALGSARAIVHFSLPSGLLSVVTGVSVWIGNYYLTRQPLGLKDLAIINTGLQWRSPILVIMASLASAIVPMLGRYLGDDDHAQTRRLQRYHIWLNLAVALAFSGVAILASSLILALYGPAFRGQNFLFGLFLIALVPTAYVTARQQELVASGRMWLQLLLFVPFALIAIGGTFWYAETLTGAILGYIQLAAWMVTAALIAVFVPPPGETATRPAEMA
ncbi:oligosaccharide flippase family protein [Sphingomonas sp.]|uniref:oligosaccharide flippase family protein n=1 Tax=Sphingomonas sp. TaxID=28214 RepID=UPI0025D9C5CD|nr:oligosaccharide flippase family protein [Sphingomonas sp.]